jgi:hypothetical protein
MPKKINKRKFVSLWLCKVGGLEKSADVRFGEMSNHADPAGSPFRACFLFPCKSCKELFIYLKFKV